MGSVLVLHHQIIVGHPAVRVTLSCHYKDGTASTRIMKLTDLGLDFKKILGKMLSLA